MSDAETTVLYVLSTVAQTCAALAAFVGRVGLYRLQRLLDRREALERDIRNAGAHPALLGREVADRLPVDDIAQHLSAGIKERGEIYRLVAELLRRLNAQASLLGQSQRALGAFEAWNLLVIVGALVGFNHVAALASSAWALRALWPIAVITAAVTAYCVFVFLPRRSLLARYGEKERSGVDQRGCFRLPALRRLHHTDVV